LPIELTPLAFLVGTWEGTGIIAIDGEEHEFSQKIEFAHDGSSALTYISSAKLNDDSATALPSELGYWRVERPRNDFDYGPGLIPGKGENPLKDYEAMETHRAEHGGWTAHQAGTEAAAPSARGGASPRPPPRELRLGVDELALRAPQHQGRSVEGVDAGVQPRDRRGAGDLRGLELELGLHGKGASAVQPTSSRAMTQSTEMR
jgi:hypothetical protein